MPASEKTPEIGARRQLTILFADLTDSTSLVAAMESEDYADLLARLKDVFNEIIPRHGGFLVQVRGDGVLAVFGLDAREDESRHATEAALDLHATVREIAHPVLAGQTLTMHSGVHSGLVLLVEGDDVLGKYVLAGDAPYIASRLSDLAQPDEILVSEDSLGSDRHFFQVDPLRHVQVKSLSAPLPVFCVRGRTGIYTRFEARREQGLTPLVGRERDLGFLLSAFDSAHGHGLQRVRVSGAPGMGKTRLIEEFLQRIRARDCIVLSGWCELQAKDAPLQPALDMLRGFCGIGHGVDEVGAAHLGELASRAGDITRHQPVLLAALNRQPVDEAELFDTLEQIFTLLAQQSRLVLFIDDWQWADDALRRLYQAVAALRRHPILLLTSFRAGSSEVPDDGTAVLDLQPLSHEHASELIDALLPAADPFLINRIAEACGGNALYLEELCHSVQTVNERSRPYFHNQPDAQRLPNYLKMLVESRVADLPPDELELLRCAAVIGNVVPRWLLDGVSAVAVTPELIASLQARDLLYNDPTASTLRFKHGITRDVVVEGVGLHQRRRLHESIARLLQARFEGDAQDAVVAMLAYHFGESTAFEEAARFAERAGDRAMQAATLDRARTHYQGALRALDQMPMTDEVYQRWMGIAQRLAMACLYDANHDQLPVYLRALELANARDDLAGAAEAEYRLAYINYALGEGPAAVRHAERATALVERMEAPAFAVQVEATLGQTLAINGRYREAMPHIDRALAAQRPFRNKARIAPAYAYTLAALGMVQGDLGDFVAAHASFDEADALIAGSHHEIQVSAASMRGGLNLLQGRWEAGMDCAERTIQLANKIGSRYMYAIGVAQKGYAMWRLDIERGFSLLKRGVGLIEVNDQALWTALHYSWFAEVLGELGDLAAMRHYVARTLMRSRKGEHLGNATAYIALASAPVSARSETPEHYLNRAYEAANWRNSARERAVVQFAHARHLWGGGEQDAARKLLEPCHDYFETHEMHWHAAQVAAFGEGSDTASDPATDSSVDGGAKVPRLG